MSFIYSSLTNETPKLSGYHLMIQDITDSTTGSTTDNSDTRIRQVQDSIIRYNYERFINAQLVITIMSVVFFNYQLISK